jgi:hypothetical protein
MAKKLILRFQRPKSSSLEAWILLFVSIVAAQSINISNL